MKDHEINVILQHRNFILFDDDSTWIKKDNSEFDVTIDFYDEAEISELVGLFLLHELFAIIPKQLVGLYRDDGSAILLNSNGHNTDRIKKRKTFPKTRFKNYYGRNLIQTDFLDVTLNKKAKSSCHSENQMISN